MNIVRWRPFEDMVRWNENFNQLLGTDFFGDEALDKTVNSSWKPTTDIYETKNEYVFKM